MSRMLHINWKRQLQASPHRLLNAYLGDFGVSDTLGILLEKATHVVSHSLVEFLLPVSVHSASYAERNFIEIVMLLQQAGDLAALHAGTGDASEFTLKYDYLS